MNPTSWPANSRSSSSGAPVTVSGVVKASSPESLSFVRFGITFTLIALSPTRARVNINGRFLRIGNSSLNMVLLIRSVWNSLEARRRPSIHWRAQCPEAFG